MLPPSLCLRDIAHKLKAKLTTFEPFMETSSAPFETTSLQDRHLVNARGTYPQDGRPRNREMRSYNGTDPTFLVKTQVEPP